MSATVIDYMPFIKKAAGRLAKHYRYSRPQEYKDLLSEGILGWCLAVNEYDLKKSGALFSFASQYTMGYMKNYIERTNRWRSRNIIWETLDDQFDYNRTPEQEAIREEELHYINVMCAIECPLHIEIIREMCNGTAMTELDCSRDVANNLVKRLRKYKIL